MAAATEHNSPDPTGKSRFIQTSTCGYFGIYDFTGVTSMLDGGFPSKVPASYIALQGEKDITAQIELGGKGRKANGDYQYTNSDSYKVNDDGSISDSAKATFEDIDGFEWFASADSPDGYVLIQEDSGNDFGERTFISKVETGGVAMTYYWIAQSGGDDNTRIMAEVGIPAGTHGRLTGHEFSGAVDLSGMLAKSGSAYLATAGNGYSKRAAETQVAINDKIIAFGLQAHTMNDGILAEMNGDRGGQLYAYQPQL